MIEDHVSCNQCRDKPFVIKVPCRYGKKFVMERYKKGFSRNISKVK